MANMAQAVKTIPIASDAATIQGSHCGSAWICTARMPVKCIAATPSAEQMPLDTGRCAKNR